MDHYDPNKKEKYQKSLRNDIKMNIFLRSFQGQSEVSYQIIKLFLEKNHDWQEVNDAQYLFNLDFYQMS